MTRTETNGSTAYSGVPRLPPAEASGATASDQAASQRSPVEPTGPYKRLSDLRSKSQTWLRHAGAGLAEFVNRFETAELLLVVSRILNSLDSYERKALESALQKAADAGTTHSEILKGTGLEPLTAAQRAAFTVEALERSFELRRQELHQSLDPDRISRLLGVPIKEVDARRANDQLVALQDASGAWRYPTWQFSPDSADSMLAGIVVAWQELAPMKPLARIRWLATPKPYFDNESPLDLLHSGHAEMVQLHARRTQAK
jgi:hypothetical protein